VFALMI